MALDTVYFLSGMVTVKLDSEGFPEVHFNCMKVTCALETVTVYGALLPGSIKL